MKTKTLIFGTLMAAAITAVSAKTDRIDLIDTDENIRSFMTEDIVSISWSKAGGAAAGDGYSVVNFNTVDSTAQVQITGYKTFAFTPYDGLLPHEITFGGDGHSDIRLLYWFNDPEGNNPIDVTKPYGWRAAPADMPVFFLPDVDKGYEGAVTVRGLYTGKDYSKFYTSYADENAQYGLGIDCQAFTMPFEPVEMKITSTELETYKGKDFLGTYKGWKLLAGNERLLKSSADTTLTMEFKANGTYVINTTDADQFDILDLFTYDETKNSFAYIPKSEEDLKNEIDLDVKFGANGVFTDDGFMFAEIRDILHDSPENVRRYFAGKKDYGMVLASADDDAYKQLLEVTPKDGQPFYYYLPDYGVRRVAATVEFASGTSIGGDCEATVSYDGEVQFKYSLTSGQQPVFTFKGKEAGNYTSATSTDILTLDGFGNATLAGQTYTYTIESGLITLTAASGDPLLYAIDLTDKTYEEVVDDPWTGAETYTCENALASLNGAEPAQIGIITVTFNKNLVGKPYEGYAAVAIDIARSGFSPIHAVASTGKYLYDAAAKRLIITNVLVGTSASASGRKNLILKVADDMKSIWFDETATDRIYSTDRTGSYVLTGTQNTLVTEETATVELADSYSGTLTAAMFSNTTEAATTLSINKEAGTATLQAMAMGTDLFPQPGDIAYSLEGNTLTLKNVTVGDGNGLGMTITADIVFTVQDDGSLLGAGTYYSSDMSAAIISVDFASAPLTPNN